MTGRADSRRAARAARRHRGGASPFRVGAIVLGVIAVLTYFGFSKHVPFTHGFRVQAVFTQANSIRKNSPVRIAGVNVGKVKKIERQPGTTAAIVTMEIDKKGLPLHKDATMKIRPRIFLEGNFFIDVQPGTPGSPTIGDNDTIPVTQTATPVQLDQVLTALQSGTREDLQAALKGYGRGLTIQPTAADDAAQDPSVRGKTAAQALNAAVRTSGPALKNLSIVNQATLGTRPHDLSRLIKGLGRVSAALDVNESDLQDLISNFNTTAGAFASQSSSLQQSIQLLGPTLVTADKAFTNLNAALPNISAFSKAILPGVNQTAATINAAFPWIKQANGLLQQSELRGLAEDLQPTVADLSKVVATSEQLLPQLDLVAQCATNVVLPTGDIKINEGDLSVDAENYKEFWYTMVGLAGEGANFDGNGPYVRFAVGGGDQTISTGPIGGAVGDKFFGKAASKPIGTRPAYPGHRPPYNPDAPCKDQKVPNLNSATTGPPDGTQGSRAASSPVASQAVRSSATTRSAGSAAPSLTAQIVSRLNPFRTAGRTP